MPPEQRDNTTKNNAILSRLQQRGRIKPVSGGRTIVEEMDYAENATFMWYSGYDQLNVSPSDVITAAEYNYAQAAVAVSMSGLEELQNAGEEQIIGHFGFQFLAERFDPVALLAVERFLSGHFTPEQQHWLEMIRDQFHRFAEEEVIPHAHGWHLRDELIACQRLNVAVQAFLRQWSAVSEKRNAPIMLDQASVLQVLDDYHKTFFLGGSANWAQIRGVLKNNFKDLAIRGVVAATFRCMEIAEEEIARAKRKRPARRKTTARSVKRTGSETATCPMN